MKSELLSAFQDCQIDGAIVRLPSWQIEDYAAFKKVMTDNLGKWNGGKKQYFTFPFDPRTLFEKLLRGQVPNFKRDWHYFPTPPKVSEFMFNVQIPAPGERLLEPSAGRGALVDSARAFINCDMHWDVVEANPLHRAYLTEAGYNVVGDDFDEFFPQPVYDTVYANPPFFSVRSHLVKMAECVKEQVGCVVCVVPGNFETKSTDVMGVLRRQFQDVNVYALPKGSFKESGTLVDAAVVSCSFREAE